MATTGRKCCHTKFRGFGFSETRCKLAAKVERDGKPYCGVHDPEKVEARRKERWAKWDRKAEAKNAEANRKAARAELERLAGLPCLSDDELRAIIAAGGVQSLLAAATTPQGTQT